MELILGALLGIAGLLATAIICYTFFLVLLLCFAGAGTPSQQDEDDCYYKVTAETIETEHSPMAPSRKVQFGPARNTFPAHPEPGVITYEEEYAELPTQLKLPPANLDRRGLYSA